MASKVGERIDWAAQEVRATIFAAPNPMPRIDDLFLIAFGGRPESYQETQSVGVPGSAAQASSLGALGQQYLLRGQGRYDLLIQPINVNPDPAPAPNAGSIHHASISDVGEAIRQVAEAAKLLAGALTRSNRVSLTIGLVFPAADHVEANAALNTILPFRLVLNDEKDFMLQYSNKYDTDNPRWKVNVLSRWSINAIQTINIIAGGLNIGSASAQIISKYEVAQKTIDASSESSPGGLGAEEMLALIDALVSRVDASMIIS